MAQDEDRAAMQALHLASWRSAYRGMLPDAYLDGPVEADLAARWAVDRDLFALVAEEDGRLVGFAAVSAHDGPYVENIHTDPALRGRGIGAALLRAVAAELERRGESRLWLTVLAENAGAIRFYRRMGGVVGALYEEELFGQKVRSLPIRWASLAALSRPPAASG